ncbi:atherin-like [Parus major]|uniref:atherin-like n=1 Tax=Parus major TaxID=9157 RepID=UPI0008F4E1EC|nr:atherin-like [Parus major]
MLNHEDLPIYMQREKANSTAVQAVPSCDLGKGTAARAAAPAAPSLRLSPHAVRLRSITRTAAPSGAGTAARSQNPSFPPPAAPRSARPSPLTSAVQPAPPAPSESRGSGPAPPAGPGRLLAAPPPPAPAPAPGQLLPPPASYLLPPVPLRTPAGSSRQGRAGSPPGRTQSAARAAAAVRGSRCRERQPQPRKEARAVPPSALGLCTSNSSCAPREEPRSAPERDPARAGSAASSSQGRGGTGTSAPAQQLVTGQLLQTPCELVSLFRD